MLVALNLSGEKILADDACRTEQYCCPWCEEEVVFKNGQVKIKHFSHKTNVSDCPNSGESRNHLICKRKVYHYLKMSGFSNVEMEKIFDFEDGSRRADVYGEKDGNKYVFEIQNSSIELQEILDRTDDYFENGIHTVWIPVIKSADIFDWGKKNASDRVFKAKLSGYDAYISQLKCQDWQVYMMGLHANNFLAYFEKSEWLVSCVAKRSKYYYEGTNEFESRSGKLKNSFDVHFSFIRNPSSINIRVSTNRWMKEDYKKGYLFPENISLVTAKIEGFHEDPDDSNAPDKYTQK